MTDKVVTIIAQDNCGPCHTTIEYLQWKKIPHNVIWLGQTMSYDVFNKIFPKSEGTPHCLVDGKEIPDIIAYFESGLE